MPLGTQVTDLAHDVLSPAANRAAWSFDFSVNTDTTGGSGKTLADYNFTITISDGEGNTQIYDLVHVSAGQYAVAAARRPASAASRDDDGTAHPTLSQNSVNIGFAFLQAAFGNNLAGKHFDIQMEATDATTGALMASTHDQLVVDTPPVATANVASVTEDVDSNGAAAGTDTFTTGNVLTDGAGQRRERQSDHGVGGERACGQCRVRPGRHLRHAAPQRRRQLHLHAEQRQRRRCRGSASGRR